jgi:hypothetical protein
MDKYVIKEYICHETGEYDAIEFKEGAAIPQSYSGVSEITRRLVKFEQVDEENDT